MLESKAYEYQTNLNPKNTTVLIEWGNKLYLEGDFPKALGKYEEAFATGNCESNIYLCLANTYNHLNKYDQARQNYSLSAALNPESAKSFHNWGKLLAKQSQYKSAIPKYKEAIRIDPNYTEAYFQLGNAYVNIGDLENGIAQYKKAIQIDPLYAAVHNNLGNVLAQKGNYEDAMEHYYQGTIIDTSLMAAYRNWEVACYKAKEVKNKPKPFVVDPKYCYLYYNWGSLLSSQHKYEEAVEKYKQAVALNGSFKYAYFNWGSALQQIGRFEEATQIFLKASESDPSHNSNLSGFEKALAFKVNFALVQNIGGQTPSDDKDLNLDKSEYRSQLEKLELEKGQLEGKLKEELTSSNATEKSAENFRESKETVSEEQSKIQSCQELSEYYKFIQREFNTVMVTSFIVNNGRFAEKDDEILSFLAWASDFIPAVGSYVTFIFEKVNERQIKNVNKKYKQCISYFVNLVEASQVIEFVARKLTFERQNLLQKEYGNAFMKGSLIRNRQVKKILNKGHITTKSEERAFLDLSTLLLECFLSDLDISYSNPDEKLLVISEVVLARMKEKFANEQKTAIKK